MPANVTLFWCQDREWRYNPDREMKGDCTRSREARAKLGAKQCRHITINLPSQWCSEVHGPRTLLRESTYLLHTAFNHAWWRCKKDAFLQFWRKLVETNYYSLDLKLLTNFGVVVNIWSVWETLFGWSRRWIPCSFKQCVIKDLGKVKLFEWIDI